MGEVPASVKGLLTISSEHRLRSENLPFDIDVWYVFYFILFYFILYYFILFYFI